jgi:hypothetical protein
MDIGQPKRIIEINPVTIPVPGELEPELRPDGAPSEPVPAIPEPADPRSP